MLIFTILHVIHQSSVPGKFCMLIFTILHVIHQSSVPGKFCMLIFTNSAYQFQKKFSIYKDQKKTSPNIDGFYRNCSCISMYISCISSKTSSHKSALGLLFWNTTRTQKTGPTINSFCRKCYGISPLLGLLFHGHFMTCK